jgi:hypothetical protein
MVELEALYATISVVMFSKRCGHISRIIRIGVSRRIVIVAPFTMTVALATVVAPASVTTTEIFTTLCHISVSSARVEFSPFVRGKVAEYVGDIDTIHHDLYAVVIATATTSA